MHPASGGIAGRRLETLIFNGNCFVALLRLANNGHFGVN
jgi:hypothetical protein